METTWKSQGRRQCQPTWARRACPTAATTAKPGPAIFDVKHAPSLPAANVPVVVTARFHDLNPFQATLLYRIDTAVNPTPTYTSVPMNDNGTGGDAIAGDGIYSATIPAQSAGTVVAFLVQASDGSGATSIFPADLKDNAGIPRECVVVFGDTIPTGSFSHHHVFITQNWAQQWAQWGGVSHESYDGTWVDGGGRIVYDWRGRYAGSPYHQYTGSPVTTVGGMHWYMPEDDQVFGTASFDKQHVPGNGALDDDTVQREQASYWMAHKIGLTRQNRRYYVYYVNGNRHGPIMEDAQVPGAEMIKEYWPNDSNGLLYKNHGWFEGDVAEQSNGYMNYSMPSWCTLGAYTTTINGVPNQYKLARYRWMWLIKQYPSSANDYRDLFALIDAANTPTTSPSYYADMEAQVDTEEWMRLSAIEHASGDWDSFFTQNQWNMYCYKPTMGKWTALKWDWNITLGGGTQTWPPDGSQLFNVGSNDPIMGAFQNYTPYRRAYLRALQDIANLAMNNAVVNPMLDAKYAAFVANGLTSAAYGLVVQDPAQPGGLEDWIGTMHNSLLTALANQGVSSVPFAINSTVVSNDVALVSGTAPLAVKTLQFNGVEWPVTWTSVTGWTVAVPLQPGANQLNVVGVDLNSQPVAGASGAVAAVSGVTPAPVGQVVINEIMYQPQVPGAEFVELYNKSSNVTFDLSGWELKGLAYTFPAGSAIAPHGFLVLAANPSAYAAAYGGDFPPFDTFTGTLQPNGETLSLVQPGGNGANDLVVTRVRYGSTAPWPAAASTNGSSLQLIDANQDNWRPGNWAAVQNTAAQTNPPPQWVFVTTNIPATSSKIYIYLGSAGDIYVDDVSLAGSAGTNLLADGDFESPLGANWNLTANFASSVISSAVSHSGSSSLHVVATAAGTGSGNAIYQNISPALTLNATYTLSFWYLQSTNGGPLTVRLSSSSNPATVNPAPPSLPALAQSTPGASNSVLAALAAFPPLWINELQADNLTGITNSAGQHVGWVELFNPSTNVVPLNGLYLANNYTNLTQWAFPSGAAINPGQFKVIFADGEINLSTTDELHASFTLGSGSGSLALTRSSNGQLQVLDYVDYANVALNHSYGSFPDGQCFNRQEFIVPTPGASNRVSLVASSILYTAPGTAYTQTFDALPNPGPTSVNADNPVTIDGLIYSLADPVDAACPAVASGSSGGLGIPALSGWFGWAAAEAKFGATDGDQTTGGMISFGPAGSPNRALGLLATSSTGPTALAARFINGTGSTLDRISLQFTGELWRQSDQPKTLEFYYVVDATGTNAFSTNATARLPSLNVAFPTDPTASGGVAVDGTSPLNQTNLSVLNQGITSWPPGAALWLVWEMADSSGKAQGLAIDNLSFSASSDSMNSAPVLAAIGNQAIALGQTVAFTASATDADQPPQTLTFCLGSGAPAGATITSGGQFSWTPTGAQAPSTNTITVIVTDNGTPPLSASQGFTVVVNEPNTPPVLKGIPNQTAYANTLLSFMVSATDTDQPPQKLTFTLGSGAPAGATITANGIFAWTPTAAQAPSTNLITVTVTDNGVPPLSNSKSFTVVVYAPNTPPVLTAIPDQTVYANTLLGFTASATDADQPPQTLTFTLGSGAPVGATITANGIFAWTPTAAQAPSTNLITVTVTDNGVPPLSNSKSFTVVVYAPNTPPVLTAIPNQTVYANTLLGFTASATDADQPPQTLTFTLGSGAPVGATITANGIFAWTPTAAQAPSTNLITVTVTDNGVPPLSNSKSFTVVVYAPNTPPVLTAIPDQTVYANTLLGFTASATDADQPPQTLTFTLGSGAPVGATITANGIFAWTPTAAQAPSTNLITVTVTDNGVPPLSNSKSFTAVVYAPNTPPVLTAIPNQTVYANALLGFTASATDSDQPPQTLTFTLGSGAPLGATITANGLFAWTPTAAQAPSTNLITVTVTDNGVPALSNSKSFTVVVYAPNTPPVLTAIPDQTVYANALLGFTASATDSDQPPQTLTFTLGSGAPVGATITANGLFAWTPTAAQAPSTNLITVTVTDNGVPPLSNSKSFTVVVYAPNTPPVLTAMPNQTVYANTLLNFTASATDSDQPPQTLTFTLGPGAPLGATITANGLFAWTPTAAQAPSTNLITVTVTDNGVPALSDSKSFTAVVYAPNTPPVLTAIPNQTVYANTLLNFTASATDSDQPPQTLTFTLGPGAPVGATITANGLFAWTPTAAQAPSTNLITVTVTDNGVPALSNSKSFTVVVYAPNTPPVLTAIPDQTVYANTLLGFTASATDTDQPPQTLTFTLGPGAPLGATITANGLFAWTPTAAQAPSTNLITVTVTDNGVPALSNSKSFTAVVYAPNTPPVLTAIPDQTVYANTLLGFTASATDTDQPPQTLTFTLGPGGPVGATITTNGLFAWTPTAAQAPGTNLITVTVTDNGVPALSNSETFTVVVYAPGSLVLQSSSSPVGPFVDRSDATIDLAQKTVTATRIPTQCFYRLRSEAWTRISSIQIIGDQVLLMYDQ